MKILTRRRVWTYASLAVLYPAGAVVIDFGLHGPWHERVLWPVMAVGMSRWIGDHAEAYAQAKVRVAEHRRLRAAYEAAAAKAVPPKVLDQ